MIPFLLGWTSHDRPRNIRRGVTDGNCDLHRGGIDADEPPTVFLRRERFLDLTAGIVAWHDHPPFDAKAAPQDLARYPWIDLDWPAALGLAWLSVELLGRLPGGLIRPPPVDIGRFRYRSGFVVARRSAEGLPPFRAPEQAVRDTALSLNRRSRNLRPARNPNVYASFARMAEAGCRTPSNLLTVNGGAIMYWRGGVKMYHGLRR